MSPTLADAGIDKKLSMRAQKLAAVPDAEFAAKLTAWRKNAEERQDRITGNLLNTGGEAGPRKGNAIRCTPIASAWITCATTGTTPVWLWRSRF